ncbi:hypothetical protein C0J52_19237 [Blattella germanica]|nr:hypothetical protein C0J52_19237 [Blattella germanica]
MASFIEDPINYSRLAALLEDVLSATTKTKRTVLKNYEATKKLAGKWKIPDNISVDIKPQCICKIENEDSKVSEVAKNIEQVVEQAQKIRSSSLNPSKMSSTAEKLHNERTSLKSACRNVKDRTSIKTTKNIISKKTETLRENSSSKQIPNGITNSTKQSKLPVTKINFLQKKVASSTTNSRRSSSLTRSCDKKPIAKSNSSSALRTTYQNDFTVTHKTTKCSSPKQSSSPKTKESGNENGAVIHKPIVTNQMSAKTDYKQLYFISNSGKISITELENLLNGDTICTNLSAVSNYEKMEKPEIIVQSCPEHGDNPIKSNMVTFRTVVIEEAIDSLGVPPELVNNNTKWDSMTYEPLIGLSSDYLALAEDSFLRTSTPHEPTAKHLIFLMEKSEDLERQFRKWSNIDESVFSNPELPSPESVAHEQTCQNQGLLEGWDLIGVWHVKSRRKFRALDKLRCITYSNEEEWKKFDMNIHKMQKLDFQLEILYVLEETVLPQLLRYDTQDPLFYSLFKTVCALCNITLLRSPVIIKSV